MNEENNVLTIKTVQIQPIRNMITAIKDVLTDATITYTDNGLKIINFDKTHTILVNVIGGEVAIKNTLDLEEEVDNIEGENKNEEIIEESE